MSSPLHGTMCTWLVWYKWYKYKYYCIVRFDLAQEYLVFLFLLLHHLLVLLHPLLVLLHPLLAVVLVPAGAAVHPHVGAVHRAVLPLPQLPIQRGQLPEHLLAAEQLQGGSHEQVCSILNTISTSMIITTRVIMVAGRGIRNIIIIAVW